MTDLRKAAEMALNYFENAYELDSHEIEIREALRQALAQPEQKPVNVVKVEHDKQVELAQMYERGWNAALAKQKPVAWMYVNDDGECEQIEYGEPFDDPSVTPLYTAPPKREWKGLTSDDKHFLLANSLNKEHAFDGFMEAIDKFLEEKNT